MPTRPARAPRATAQPSPEPPPEPTPEPEPSAADPALPAPGATPPATQPSGYKGLKVWQRAMELATGVHEVARALPKPDQDALATELRRTAVQIPSYIAAGNSLFQRAEYVQYLSAAHGAVARLETLLLVADRLGHLGAREGAALLANASHVSALLRALTRALQPPPSDGSSSSARPPSRRPVPAGTAD